MSDTVTLESLSRMIASGDERLSQFPEDDLLAEQVALLKDIRSDLFPDYDQCATSQPPTS